MAKAARQLEATVRRHELALGIQLFGSGKLQISSERGGIICEYFANMAISSANMSQTRREHTHAQWPSGWRWACRLWI